MKHSYYPQLYRDLKMFKEVSTTIDDIPADLSQEKREQTTEITEVTESKEVAHKPAENTEFQQSTEKLASTTSDKIEKVGQWARKGILKAEERAEQAEASKKKIIREAAKKLEGKVTTNTIAMRLAELLHGLVSDRYIRECLEDKYKQEYRAENAKKQVKKQLAELAPLELEKQESALHVVEENNGMVLLQDRSTASSDAFKTAEKSSDDNISTESGSDKDRIPPVATFQAVSSGLHKKKNEEVHIFSIARNALYDYLQWIIRKHAKSQHVFFHVVIDKKTRQPITAGLGDLSKPVE